MFPYDGKKHNRTSWILKNGRSPASFLYFRSFQQQFYSKIVDYSRNRTRIVGVEGEHADHLTTTMALTTWILTTYIQAKMLAYSFVLCLIRYTHHKYENGS